MESTKMLQAILRRVALIDEKIDINIAETKKNGVRIDKLGKQLAYVEDDSPTVEEFDELEKRVARLEQQSTKN